MGQCRLSLTHLNLNGVIMIANLSQELNKITGYDRWNNSSFVDPEAWRGYYGKYISIMDKMIAEGDERYTYDTNSMRME